MNSHPSLAALWEVLSSTPTPPDLGPGPRAGILPLPVLEARLESALGSFPLAPDAALALRALFLLWHDHHDAAHAIVQELETPDGSYLHALLHRREPDFGNAAYWLRRARAHPSFALLAERLQGLLAGSAVAGLRGRLLVDGKWDPFAMLALCQAAVEGRSGDAAMVRDVQRHEFEALLAHLVR